jgi:uncharacterized protein
MKGLPRMRKPPLIAALIVLLGCCSGLPCKAQQVLDGDWIGGVDFNDRWQSIKIHIKTEESGLTGTLDLPDEGRNGMPLSRVVAEFPRVRIEWQNTSGTATCQGQLKDGAMTGEFQQGETRATFQLAHVAKVDARTYEQYAGSYKLGRDRFVDIGTYDLLKFSDTTTGRTGPLYPLSETTFFSGPSAEIPLPVELRVTFLKNKKGTVTGLVWSEAGAPALRGKKLPHTQERVTFRSGDMTMTGTLILPAAKGPFPAIVKVDPGYSFYPKYGFFPYFFVRHGIAFLTLNERSLDGKPAGYSQSSFEERARDALAVVAMLKKRQDIDPRRIGLHGSSLSSWVAPLAATLSPDVAFLILRVGSAIPPAENIVYEIENDLRERHFPETDIAEAKALRRLLNKTILGNAGWEALKSEIEKSRHEKWFGYARVGWFSSIAIPPDASTLKSLRDPISYDPVPVLEQVAVPVLAYNAELDKSVNTKESVPIMERALRAKRTADVTIIVLPKASHDLLDAKTGYNSEYPRLKRHASGYWDTMANWLRKHVKVKP